jgi:predicted transcriptional regulator
MDSYEKESENPIVISRFAAVIEKEEPMKKILKIVRNYKNGINGIKLERMLNKWGYRKKVMYQLIYLGLIAEAIDGTSLYSITEKGCKVLEACGR